MKVIVGTIIEVQQSDYGHGWRGRKFHFLKKYHVLDVFISKRPPSTLLASNDPQHRQEKGE